MKRRIIALGSCVTTFLEIGLRIGGRRVCGIGRGRPDENVEIMEELQNLCNCTHIPFLVPFTNISEQLWREIVAAIKTRNVLI